MENTTLTLRPPVWALLAAVIIGGLFYVSGKKIEVRNNNPTLISINGEGKVSTPPDIAQLSFGVTMQRQPTAKQAMDMLGKSMQAVVDAVEKAGVPMKDIRTEQLSLNPAYDWNEGRQIPRGFDASQSLSVKVRDLDTVSAVLAAASNAGANQVGGVQFTIDDPEKARAEARGKAIEQAQEKAKTLAKQLGMRLGPVKTFNEGGGYNAPVPMMARGMAMEKSMDVAETPIPAGEQEIVIQVNITYELK